MVGITSDGLSRSLMDDTVGRASGYICLASVAATGLPVQAGSVAFIPMAVQRCCTRDQDPSKLSFQPHTDFQIATSELSKESATQHVASLNLTRFVVYRARLRQADFLLWAALDSVPMGGSRRGASRAKLCKTPSDFSGADREEAPCTHPKGTPMSSEGRRCRR